MPRKLRGPGLVAGAILTAAATLGAAVGVAAALAPRIGNPVSSGGGTHPSLGARPPLRSTIVAADGSPMATVFDENRIWTGMADIPDVVVNAVVDTEDASFWRNKGFDVRGSVRAIRDTARGTREGASTITEQFIKLLGASRPPGAAAPRDVGTKLREAVLARRLATSVSKHQLLERYLNLVYFGNGAYGVGAAAERYFGVPAAQLRPEQAAMLAGLISGPTDFDPFAHPDDARARRLHVLDRMVTMGHLAPAARDAAAITPLPARPVEPPSGGDPSLVAAVEHELLADPRLGATERARRDLLLRGGIRVVATTVPSLQAAAVKAVTTTLPRGGLTAALVAVDPATGEIRALVGGTAAGRTGFNIAVQGARQPGSSFKAVTLTAALEAGHQPSEPVDGTAPCTLPLPPPQREWHVDNYDGEAGGVTTLADATAHSLNCAYARLVLALGPAKVVDMARRLGVDRRLDAVPSITLGAEAVSPMEMATVFATLAAEGVRHDTHIVARVIDRDGNVLVDNSRPGRSVVEPEVARAVTGVLQGVISGGTGRQADIGRPAAGKTGTAEDWHDAWFCGYVPQLATAVWMGSAAGEVPMIGVQGINVAGGTFPAQIWKAFMTAATAALPPLPFTPADPARWAPVPPPPDATTTTSTTTTTKPGKHDQPDPSSTTSTTSRHHKH